MAPAGRHEGSDRGAGPSPGPELHPPGVSSPALSGGSPIDSPFSSSPAPGSASCGRARAGGCGAPGGTPPCRPRLCPDRKSCGSRGLGTAAELSWAPGFRLPVASASQAARGRGERLGGAGRNPGGESGDHHDVPAVGTRVPSTPTRGFLPFNEPLSAWRGWEEGMAVGMAAGRCCPPRGTATGVTPMAPSSAGTRRGQHGRSRLGSVMRTPLTALE